jgi:hypothetical protein
MKTVVIGMTAAVFAASITCGRAQDEVPVLGGPAESRARLNVEPVGEGGLFYVVADQGEIADDEGEYWLGVQLAALPELAKQQLGVEHGLAVEEVAADSPAAKAEIRRFDILVKADDTPLKDAGDLIKSVEASQGKEMTLTVVRQGKDRTLKVIATKRPETARTVRVHRPEFAEEIKRLEEALARLKAKAGDKGVDLLFARPAIVAPKTELNKAFSYRFEGGKPADFPGDLTVQVNKRGKEPAEIHVKRGDKEWNITEKEIDELPEDLRPHVLHYLGKGPTFSRGPIGWGEGGVIRVNPQGKVEGEIRIPPMGPRPPVPPRPPVAATRSRPAEVPGVFSERRIIDDRRAPDDRQDDKLDLILKKLNSIERLESDVKELRKELDEVRGKK